MAGTTAQNGWNNGIIWVRLQVNIAGIASRDARAVRPFKVKGDSNAW